MRGVLIFLAGLIIGGGLSFIVATGIGAGVGVATGLMAGACMTAESAKELGLITPEQVDQVLNAAVEQITANQLAEADKISGSDAGCQKVISDLKAAAAKNR
ncbi:hypothetical protein H0I76_07485 [Limibaculum sp. M0105]|uniref:Uncharacterized protein n=1 Tax=Thermohalobaculum xanthum TaxID=2753746 RepID=A0A8J7SEM3_9RHOB|nr:hypothetical protein [Thermohalobaculum xanthum]MBK0399027.1 hypothetical protein [Thermohalobaculum xanthum]